MTPVRFARCLLLTATLLVSSSGLGQDRSATARVDAAFQKFWAAGSPADAERIAGELVQTGVSFDEALRRLRLGRTYTAQEAGVLKLGNRTEDGVEHHYAVNIPPAYDPERRYSVRFQLHGGIGARENNQPRGTGEIGALAGAEQIYVIPYAWQDEPWWSDDQVLNLRTILDGLKRTYNVDENHVVVSGVSDGATGAYYIAMKETTSFSSFLPLNGFILVLSNSEIDDGQLLPNNLRNKPLFVVNGGRDRLYPTSIVEPFTNHLMNAGVMIDYHPQPEGEHNTAWWPEIKGPFEAFAASHPRDPDPDQLTWEAAAASGEKAHNRAHWLVLDEFGSAPGEAAQLPDVNEIGMTETIFGETAGRLFGKVKSAGRVDLMRSGNTVHATSHGVKAFTLLLSPAKFDLTQPITVTANGKEVFHGRVQQSVQTLLKWAARDNDRTMLYASELPIRLTR